MGTLIVSQLTTVNPVFFLRRELIQFMATMQLKQSTIATKHVLQAMLQNQKAVSFGLFLSIAMSIFLTWLAPHTVRKGPIVTFQSVE